MNIEEGLLENIKENPSVYLPEYTPRRLSAFIEGFNAAAYPNRPLNSMNVSSEFGEFLSRGSHSQYQVSPIDFVEQFFGYGADAVNAYIFLRKLIRTNQDPKPFEDHIKGSVPANILLKVVATGPTLSASVNSLIEIPGLLGPSPDGYQVAAFLAGHRFANRQDSEAERFINYLNAVYSILDSDRWSWARALSCVTASKDDLLRRVSEDFQRFSLNLAPVEDPALQVFHAIRGTIGIFHGKSQWENFEK